MFTETLTAETTITISTPARSFIDAKEDYETTWGQFVADNADDPETVSDIAHQIANHNYAEIGGGASPVVWVFA